MSKTVTCHINFTGGIVSPGTLKTILTLAKHHLIKQVRFGLRQQLVIDVPVQSLPEFTSEMEKQHILCAPQKEMVPNLLSSYPAAGLFTTDSWLREGVYKDVFNEFDFTPKYKVNICDGTQNLVPFFTGHINWISSKTPHFWYLYLRFPKTQTLYCWPELVYTNDIALVSKKLEGLIALQLIEQTFDAATAGQNLFETLKKNCRYSAKSADSPLSLPRFSLPYYEGFNKEENGFWLGLYRRDEAFPVSFLLDVCAVCLESGIAQLYTTPWKSLIIKGIQLADLERWNWVLGKYRINVRHAANELAWQVEDRDESGLTIKRHLIRQFDKEDVRTHGLSFGVQSRPSANMFGSIIICKQQNKNPHRLRSLERYDLLHTANFNPNASELVLFRQGLEKEHLGTYLISLCKLFYEQQEASCQGKISEHKSATSLPGPEQKHLVYQCIHCGTVYDPKHGEPEQHIVAGTSFPALPEQFYCPTCDGAKKDFNEVDFSTLKLQAG